MVVVGTLVEVEAILKLVGAMVRLCSAVDAGTMEEVGATLEVGAKVSS